LAHPCKGLGCPLQSRQGDPHHHHHQLLLLLLLHSLWLVCWHQLILQSLGRQQHHCRRTQLQMARDAQHSKSKV